MCISASAFAEDVIPTDGAPAITDTVIADDAETEEEDIIDEDVAENEENIEDEEIVEEDEIVENDEIADDDEDVNDEDVFEADNEETAKEDNKVAEEDEITEDEPVIKSETVNVTPYASSTAASDTVKVELEDFVQSPAVAVDPVPSDSKDKVSGTCIIYNEEGGPYSFNTTVDVEKAGKYKFELWATFGTPQGQGDPYLSQIDYMVNNDGTWHSVFDEVTGDGTNGNSHKEIIQVGSIMPTSWNPNVMYRHLTMKNNIALAAGENKISFRINPNVNDGKMCYALMDRYEVTRVGDLDPDTNAGTIRVEFENIAADKGTVRAYASTDVGVSGKFLFWQGGEQVSFTTTVNAAKAGAYELMIFGTRGSDANKWPSSRYMSEIRYSVNGGDTLKLPDTISKCEAAAYTSTVWPINATDAVWKLYKMYTTVNLKKGENTITFTIPQRYAEGNGNGGIYGVLDYFELTEDITVSSLTLTADSATKRGSAVNYTLKNQDGTEVSARNLDTLTVTVEDEKIAGVANRAVTARNYGATNLKVYAKTNDGTEFNLTAPIKVVSETGLSIENVSKTETGVSVTLNAAEAYASGAKLLIVVQGKKGDRVTSVTKVVTEDVPAIAKGASATLTPTVDGVDANSTISVYLVKADNTDCAVYKKFAL